MLSLRRHMRIKSLWRGAGTNTFSVKLPEELLHCNWFSFSLSFCQVHNWIWVSQMKVWCNTVFVLFWSQEASLGLFICLMVYFSWIRVHPIFIWHIFSEFTILTVFQAGAGGGGGGGNSRKETLSDHKGPVSGEAVSALIRGILGSLITFWGMQWMFKKLWKSYILCYEYQLQRYIWYVLSYFVSSFAVCVATF